MSRVSLYILAILSAALLIGCSSTKHVPEGEYLLNNVSISINDNKDVKSTDLTNYLRQTPNHKVLGFAKLQLATYNLSGADTAKWYNKWFRRLGQPPAIYSQELTEASRSQLTKALINKGYMDAEVEVDTTMRPDKKKIDVTYNVTTGTPHRITSVAYNIPDTAISRLVMSDTIASTIKPGTLFDRNNLDAERTRITERLRNRGYYAFTKEYITFYADTAENSYDVDISINVRHPRRPNQATIAVADTASHTKYYIRNVYFVTASDQGIPADELRKMATDTVTYKDINVIYVGDRYIKPEALEEKNFITPGKLYRSFEVDRTYEALSQLGILKSINIEMKPAGRIGSDEWLDAFVYLSRNKKQGVTLELGGTNSEGDLGFGVGLTYLHRNLAKMSNLFTAKLRTNYESLSGNFSGLINDRYTEHGAEVGITFPKFEFPFVSRNFKRRIKASTEFALSFNYQERPEYTRIIAGAAWKYKWANPNNRERRTLDLIDINYVYLPESTIDFINQIAPSNPLLRYSYEDHFIMRMGYSYYRTNKRISSASLKRHSIQPWIYTFRAGGETAGNTLYMLSHLTKQKRSDDVYKFLGIQYSQYVKAEIEYSLTRNFDNRHSVAFRVGGGIGVPYGNSRVLPFEKRFYAGGANGVRGWGVRTLGPGSYDSRNYVTDFINQCGDISLILSAEYRMKLFWVFEGAFFADAGNIWTIHNYENQPGGLFRFSKFWKQLAASYGIGLRLDFEYFLLRFDLGIKAHNPAMNQEPWPIIHPRWKRDTTLHFSVGYPF
ncbi:MAG: BamA/TamA family outer membrane protein [Muribaculaceae bacterium]|nr:BamA/TamA family outer membrane protein [Muribaculaceae bacterium]